MALVAQEASSPTLLRVIKHAYIAATALLLAGCSSTTTYKDRPLGGIEVKREGAVEKFINWFIADWHWAFVLAGGWLVIVALGEWLESASGQLEKSSGAAAANAGQSKKKEADLQAVASATDDEELLSFVLDSAFYPDARVKAAKKIKDHIVLRTAIRKLPAGELRDALQAKLEIATALEEERIRDTTYSVGEAAKILSVSENTIYSWVRSGKLEVEEREVGRGSMRITKASVRAAQ
jgi:excisionase family DNA binding protein